MFKNRLLYLSIICIISVVINIILICVFANKDECIPPKGALVEPIWPDPDYGVYETKNPADGKILIQAYTSTEPYPLSYETEFKFKDYSGNMWVLCFYSKELNMEYTTLHKCGSHEKLESPLTFDLIYNKYWYAPPWHKIDNKDTFDFLDFYSCDWNKFNKPDNLRSIHE